MTQTPSIKLVTIDTGAIAIMHRPKLKLLSAMKQMGVTHLVTLLSRQEGALVVGSAATTAGLEWVWVKIANGQQPTLAQQREIVAGLSTLVRVVRSGAKVVIHCSAGIHRTGMFTYALLRSCDLGPEDAMSTLARLRSTTAEGLTEQRRAWAETMAESARHGLLRHYRGAAIA